MYARGMTTREIQGHLEELYGIEVSPELISVVTDAVVDEVAQWQGRPLEPVYAIVFFDALRVKIRDRVCGRPVGAKVSNDRRELETELGTCHTVVCLPGLRPKAHLARAP